MDDLIRKKLKKILPPEHAVNGQYALEHILMGVSMVSPMVLTARKHGENEAIISMEFAELITLWSWGLELKAQDNRAKALICKLLKTGIR